MIDKDVLFKCIGNSENEFLGSGRYPEYGKLVMSGMAMGMPYDFDHAIGYIVQIRVSRGAYGSDQYLVRHQDGTLTTHENQSFWIVSEFHQEAALSLFEQTPDKEGGDTEYTIAEGFPEVGYIIKESCDSPKSESQSLMFGVTITNE
jgi:hypothetical protein